MSAAEIAEQLRIEQIPADIARTTQELLYEPRKYRVPVRRRRSSAPASRVVSLAALLPWLTSTRIKRHRNQSQFYHGTPPGYGIQPASCDTPENPMSGG